MTLFGEGTQFFMHCKKYEADGHWATWSGLCLEDDEENVSINQKLSKQ